MERVVDVEKVFSPQRNLKGSTDRFRHIECPFFVKNDKRYCSNGKKLAVKWHQKQHIKQQQRKNTELGILLQDVHASHHGYSIYSVIKGQNEGSKQGNKRQR